MLIDKYLSAYDFREFHSIKVNASVNDIYEKVLNSDITRSLLIRFLFRLRGIPYHLHSIKHLTDIGFVKLDEQQGKEIVYGMITASPTFSCCHQNISPDSFIQNKSSSVIKTVINFQIQAEITPFHKITTETRISCGSSEIRSKFKVYWFLIKPFSQLIRRLILQEIKSQLVNSKIHQEKL